MAAKATEIPAHYPGEFVHRLVRRNMCKHTSWNVTWNNCCCFFNLLFKFVRWIAPALHGQRENSNIVVSRRVQHAAHRLAIALRHPAMQHGWPRTETIRKLTLRNNHGKSWWKIPWVDLIQKLWKEELAICNTSDSQPTSTVKFSVVSVAISTPLKITRWSPRTRLLRRMLMVQMSKHMVMQWRTIPFCNSLFEQSCTCFPCYQSAVWSGKCGVWSVK